MIKVSNNNSINVTKAYNDNKPKALDDKKNKSKSFDSIEISKEGMEIARYVNMSRDTSDVRVQKVNEIKNKIQNGTYKVSSEELAAKILDAINEGKIKP